MYRDNSKNFMAFDSITEMAAWANANPDPDKGSYSERRDKQNPEWYANLNWDQVMAKCAMGDDSAVPEAKALMAKLEHSINIDASSYESSVAGCFPNVAEFLAGEPECMYDVAKVKSDLAPLSIYMDMITSGAITAEQYYKRGLTILALTMLLSTIRPITLHVCCISDGDGMRTEEMKARNESYSVTVARVETAPLDLARAAYMMTNVSVPRRLFYSLQRDHFGFRGTWPRFYGVPYMGTTSPEYSKRARELLGIDSEALYFAPPNITDADCKQMLEQPVEWLNKMLKQYGGIDAE